MGKIKTAILINDTSNEYHIGSQRVIKNIFNLCQQHNIKIIQSFTRRSISDKDLSKLQTAIKKVNLIIINGEGSLHHHPRRNTIWFQTVMETIPKNKKTVLINTLWQKMGGMKDINKYLDKLNLISVREQKSYNDLISIYPHPEKIIITPDIIFATPLSNVKVGYGDSVHRRIRKLLKNHKNYIPLSYIEQGYYHDIKSLNTPSLDAYISWLKGLELYVTGRFHGVCLAIMANIPFLAIISNSHKIDGLLKDMNCSELLINPFSEAFLKKELAIKALPKIRKYMGTTQKRIDNLFNLIGKL